MKKFLADHELRYIFRRKRIKNLGRWIVNPIRRKPYLNIKENFHWQDFEKLLESTKNRTWLFSPKACDWGPQMTREWNLKKPT